MLKVNTKKVAVLNYVQTQIDLLWANINLAAVSQNAMK